MEVEDDGLDYFAATLGVGLFRTADVRLIARDWRQIPGKQAILKDLRERMREIKDGETMKLK